jgi:hypothetical protein
VKGRISKNLESILQSPDGRRELRTYLIRGEDGRVVVNGKTYRVETHATGQRSAHVTVTSASHADGTAGA